MAHLTITRDKQAHMSEKDFSKVFLPQGTNGESNSVEMIRTPSEHPLLLSEEAKQILTPDTIQPLDPKKQSTEIPPDAPPALKLYDQFYRKYVPGVDKTVPLIDLSEADTTAGTMERTGSFSRRRSFQQPGAAGLVRTPSIVTGRTSYGSNRRGSANTKGHTGDNKKNPPPAAKPEAPAPRRHSRGYEVVEQETDAGPPAYEIKPPAGVPKDDWSRIRRELMQLEIRDSIQNPHPRHQAGSSLPDPGMAVRLEYAVPDPFRGREKQYCMPVIQKKVKASQVVQRLYATPDTDRDGILGMPGKEKGKAKVVNAGNYETCYFAGRYTTIRVDYVMNRAADYCRPVIQLPNMAAEDVQRFMKGKAALEAAGATVTA
eukprot:GHVQ01000174.1.p1 GENE.GHVQ01000174.1~~GHVQ01000174.1.p1  ORF type:complete len:373 (-),score=38.85 GHVQ01000174.1:1995-3113(-)